MNLKTHLIFPGTHSATSLITLIYSPTAAASSLYDKNSTDLITKYLNLFSTHFICYA